jgi:hypothetical protein
MKSIKVSGPTGTHFFPIWDDHTLYTLCIKMAGGGHSESQTAEAMVIRDQLEKGEKIAHNKFNVEIVEV